MQGVSVSALFCRWLASQWFCRPSIAIDERVVRSNEAGQRPGEKLIPHGYEAGGEFLSS